MTPTAEKQIRGSEWLAPDAWRPLYRHALPTLFLLTVAGPLTTGALRAELSSPVARAAPTTLFFFVALWAPVVVACVVGLRGLRHAGLWSGRLALVLGAVWAAFVATYPLNEYCRAWGKELALRHGRIDFQLTDASLLAPTGGTHHFAQLLLLFVLLTPVAVRLKASRR